jgi:hypothetical protein
MHCTRLSTQRVLGGWKQRSLGLAFNTHSLTSSRHTSRPHTTATMATSSAETPGKAVLAPEEAKARAQDM